MRHFYVDRVVSIIAGESAVGIKAIGLSEDAFADHFPGNPIYPGAFLIEGIAQTAGLLLHETTDQLAIMASVDRVRFVSYARPGETIRFAVRMESIGDGRVARIRGDATAGDRAVCSGCLTFRLFEPQSVVAPEYMPLLKRSHAVWRGEFPGE